jgi:hypothetical protein
MAGTTDIGIASLGTGGLGTAGLSTAGLGPAGLGAWAIISASASQARPPSTGVSGSPKFCSGASGGGTTSTVGSNTATSVATAAGTAGASGVGGIEAEIFRATVGAVALDHFQPEDLRLLCAYARAFSPKFIRLLRNQSAN